MVSVRFSEPRERTIPLTVRGGTMAALEFGPEARPLDVIFSHANGYNARTYRSILGPLGDRLRILAIDLRGHGATRLPTPTEDRRDWTDISGDLLALLGVLDGPPVVLAGHSMGATTSVLAAAAAPERVKALALLDPVILPRAVIASGLGVPPDSPLVVGAKARRRIFASREAAVEAYRGRGGFKTWTDEMLADYVAAGFRDRDDGQVELACDPAWEVSNFVSQRHDSWAALAALSGPVRILTAEHNSTARLEGEADALLATGRFSIETLPGTSHFLPMERPERVRETLAALCEPTENE